MMPPLTPGNLWKLVMFLLASSSGLLSQGQVCEHEHSRGAQLKGPSCHIKIKTFPPPDAGGAAAAAFWL